MSQEYKDQSAAGQPGRRPAPRSRAAGGSRAAQASKSAAERAVSAKQGAEAESGRSALQSTAAARAKTPESAKMDELNQLMAELAAVDTELEKRSRSRAAAQSSRRPAEKPVSEPAKHSAGAAEAAAAYEAEQAYTAAPRATAETAENAGRAERKSRSAGAEGAARRNTAGGQNRAAAQRRNTAAGRSGNSSPKRRRRRRNRYNWPYIIGIVLCLMVMLAAIVFAGKKIYQAVSGRAAVETSAAAAESESDSEAAEPVTEAETTPSALDAVLADAEFMALQYDYDGAIALLNSSEYAQDPQVSAKVQELEGIKATLVEQDLSRITHVFFHILVEDPARTFIDTQQGRGYNSVMTTVPEFEAILEQMYARGYVLVRLHDMAEMQTDAEGNAHMVKKPILLPEGKKAFVMSQDDVCYYEYMEGSGCANRILLDENGELTCEYTDAAGNVTTGDYDLVPILNRFVEEHPDFSYKGAKAVLAFTGYNGILGYRTDESYDAASPNFDPEKEANPNIEADREYVKQLTQALKEDGYEFASHSWGHRDYGTIEWDRFKTDADKWERNVEPLLPDPCDIILFPFGADIGDWRPYAADNERLQYLTGLGFRYYCNVDSSQYWVQLGDGYLRQGRRNLDGYRLWMDYGEGANKLSDLMDVQQVFDTRRPTPIDWQ